MVKFLHTADWQLGMKGEFLGEAAKEVRRVRFETVKNILNLARDENVDFVVIAGDLFENNIVSRDIVEKLIELFEGAPDIPIFVLPGNHDPLEPDSIYCQKIWKSVPHNVRLLSENKPVELQDLNVVLYPCPITQKRSRTDPTEWIPYQETEQIRIGLAHGTLDIWPEPNFPINPNRAAISGLDYLALGDWHSLFIYDNRTAYPGTPEATRFDETDPGHCLVVELAKGREPVIQPKKCSQLRWEVRNEEIESLDDFNALFERLEKIPDKATSLIELNIKGAVGLETYNSIEELTKIKDFLYICVNTSSLYLKPSDIIKDLFKVVPQGTLILVAESLEALISREARFSHMLETTPDELEQRLSKIASWTTDGGIKAHCLEPDIIQKALSLMYQLSKEESR